jgi:hypothetical protein
MIVYCEPFGMLLIDIRGSGSLTDTFSSRVNTHLKFLKILQDIKTQNYCNMILQIQTVPIAISSLFLEHTHTHTHMYL